MSDVCVGMCYVFVVYMCVSLCVFVCMCVLMRTLMAHVSRIEEAGWPSLSLFYLFP